MNSLDALVFYKTYMEVETELLQFPYGNYMWIVSLERSFIEGATTRSEWCRLAVMLVLPRGLPLNLSE